MFKRLLLTYGIFAAGCTPNTEHLPREAHAKEKAIACIDLAEIQAIMMNLKNNQQQEANEQLAEWGQQGDCQYINETDTLVLLKHEAGYFMFKPKAQESQSQLAQWISEIYF